MIFSFSGKSGQKFHRHRNAPSGPRRQLPATSWTVNKVSGLKRPAYFAHGDRLIFRTEIILGRELLAGSVTVKKFEIGAGDVRGVMFLHVAVHPGNGIFRQDAFRRVSTTSRPSPAASSAPGRPHFQT